ncbi:MAG: hypothetical protein D6731_10705, partial [Planctomycetota bacterium]
MPSKPSSPLLPRRSALLLLALALLCALGGVGWLLLGGEAPPPRHRSARGSATADPAAAPRVAFDPLPSRETGGADPA